MGIEIRPASPRSRDCRALIAELDQYQLELYPAESNHLDSAEELEQPNAVFLGAYEGDTLLGIGALKVVDHDIRYGEIKRVYVPASARGRGVSVKLMEQLEHQALRLGISVIRLETGIYQPEAIGLYRKLGYEYRNSFGNYPTDDPMSVFMEKSLGD